MPSTALRLLHLTFLKVSKKKETVNRILTFKITSKTAERSKTCINDFLILKRKEFIIQIDDANDFKTHFIDIFLHSAKSRLTNHSQQCSVIRKKVMTEIKTFSIILERHKLVPATKLHRSSNNSFIIVMRKNNKLLQK